MRKNPKPRRTHWSSGELADEEARRHKEEEPDNEVHGVLVNETKKKKKKAKAKTKTKKKEVGLSSIPLDRVETPVSQVKKRASVNFLIGSRFLFFL
jgi:hypothetical protein